MRIGDIVAVDVGPAPATHLIGIVTRADSWNGIWVTSLGGAGSDVVEQPLGRFAARGRLIEGPTLEAPEKAERPPPSTTTPVAAALLLGATAVATCIALRVLARRLS